MRQIVKLPEASTWTARWCHCRSRELSSRQRTLSTLDLEVHSTCLRGELWSSAEHCWSSVCRARLVNSEERSQCLTFAWTSPRWRQRLGLPEWQRTWCNLSRRALKSPETRCLRRPGTVVQLTAGWLVPCGCCAEYSWRDRWPRSLARRWPTTSWCTEAQCVDLHETTRPKPWTTSTTVERRRHSGCIVQVLRHQKKSDWFWRLWSSLPRDDSTNASSISRSPSDDGVLGRCIHCVFDAPTSLTSCCPFISCFIRSSTNLAKYIFKISKMRLIAYGCMNTCK